MVTLDDSLGTVISKFLRWISNIYGDKNKNSSREIPALKREHHLRGKMMLKNRTIQGLWFRGTRGWDLSIDVEHKTRAP